MWNKRLRACLLLNIHYFPCKNWSGWSRTSSCSHVSHHCWFVVEFPSMQWICTSTACNSRNQSTIILLVFWVKIFIIFIISTDVNMYMYVRSNCSSDTLVKFHWNKLFGCCKATFLSSEYDNAKTRKYFQCKYTRLFCHCHIHSPVLSLSYSPLRKAAVKQPKCLFQWSLTKVIEERLLHLSPLVTKGYLYICCNTVLKCLIINLIINKRIQIYKE